MGSSAFDCSCNSHSNLLQRHLKTGVWRLEADNREERATSIGVLLVSVDGAHDADVDVRDLATLYGSPRRRVPILNVVNWIDSIKELQKSYESELSVHPVEFQDDVKQSMALDLE